MRQRRRRIAPANVRQHERQVHVQRYRWGVDLAAGFASTEMLYGSDGQLLGIDYTVVRTRPTKQSRGEALIR